MRDVSCLEPNTVLALVDGRLLSDALSLSNVRQHIAGCQACADLVALAAGGGPGSAAPARLEKGASLGRYVILDVVGRGGMGEVYAAYDPQLDRKVALKLLHGRVRSDALVEAARARLLREAKAIARLSHPNVVVVYDAGEIESRVFLAMEFVDGQTLAAWLDAAPRTWREIREVFVAAGRGLAAAHEAGLVHRDFKPQNVMVGRDGSVRVMDFGLASDGSHADAGAPLEAIALAAADAPAPPSVALTHTGMLLGTPLYMSPEQLSGRGTDPRTDQFSFCVSLYHALYGERPFPSDTLSALIDAVRSGRVREPPQKTKTRVPSFVGKALLRGLRSEPGERFESMPALLAELQRDPAQRRRRLAIGAAALALVTVLAVGAQQASTRGQRFCRGASDKVTTAWELSPDGTRRNAIHRAFAATGRSFAEETWQRASGLIDDWSRRWSAAYTDACEATHVRGDQSAEVLDLRMACLEEARVGLRSLTDVLAHADGKVLIQAVNGAQALPALERCANIQLLRAAVAPPADPGTRARVDALRPRLAEVKALADTGQLAEAHRKATPLLAEARATGYIALQAEVLEALGSLDYYRGELGSATALLEEALWTALTSRRDDIAVKCAGNLAALAGYHRTDFAQAARWDQLGRAMLGRLGPGQEDAAAWLMHDRAMLHMRRGEMRAALEIGQASLAQKQKFFPPGHSATALSWELVANVKTELGDHAGALQAINEAVKTYQQAFGPGNPQLARAFGNRGEILKNLGRYAEAETDLRESIERYAMFIDRDHSWVAYPLTALGTTLLATDRPKQALPVLEKALRIREPGEPPDLVAETRFALARALWTAGSDAARARKLATAAREGYAQLPALAARAAEVDAWLGGHP